MMRFALTVAVSLLAVTPPAWAQQKSTATPAQSAAVAPKPAPAPKTAPAPAPAKIEGFRTARFGMAAADVRKAIQADFGVSDNDIKVEINPVQKTTALTIDVKDLLPGTGLARVSYLFGYKSNRLFTVLVVWAHAFSADNSREVLVDAANVLRAHFESENFPRGIVVDSALPDGSVLVFRGMDAQGRMVALAATALYTANPSGAGDKAAPQPDPVLRLTYVEDPQHPDVYTIKPGEF
jgi:hypothetical protein